MSVVNAPLAYVRLTDGGTVQLAQGDTVPDGAEAGHIEQLIASGVLGEAEQQESEPKAPRGGRQGSGD